MELDQFKIIPEEKLDGFLKQYADIVGLPFENVKKLYQLQMSYKRVSDTPTVTQIVEEKLSQRRLQEQSSSTQEVTASNKAETLVIPVKTVGIDSPKSSKVLPSKQFKSDDRLVPQSHKGSRLSRYGKNDDDKKSLIPAALLGLLALLLVGVIFFAVWKQIEKNQMAKEKESSLVSSSQAADETSDSSANQPQTQISVEGAENYLIATVTKSKETVDVTVALTEADSSWISLTNSEIGEAGITLTRDNPSYTATLPAEVVESLLTLGVTRGVSVTIDGQALDLSALTSTDISYITLRMQ